MPPVPIHTITRYIPKFRVARCRDLVRGWTLPPRVVGADGAEGIRCMGPCSSLLPHRGQTVLPPYGYEPVDEAFSKVCGRQFGPAVAWDLFAAGSAP